MSWGGSAGWSLLWLPGARDAVAVHLLSESCQMGWSEVSTLSPADSFWATFIRLAILVALSLVVVVFLRVLIQLKIEQRRRDRLLATRDIGALSPSQFEAYVGLLFESAGYRVRRTGGSGDRGIDLRVYRDGRMSVVQCKRYEDNVGPGTVREFIGAMTNAGAARGILVTTSGFTAGAEREARKAPYRIDLLDGERLVRWARQYGLPGELMDSGPGESVR